MKEQGVKVKYLVGTMIEVPRGALTADEIAAEAAVLLVRHQRPDAADLRLLARRRRQVPAHLPGQEDPRAGSVRVDRRRRRRRARRRRACESGRKTRPDLKLGICGEHGGDPASVHFFHKVGLDYVSMSPYRVPVARLAAAQAALSVKVGRLNDDLRPQERRHRTDDPDRAIVAQSGSGCDVMGGPAGAVDS